MRTLLLLLATTLLGGCATTQNPTETRPQSIWDFEYPPDIMDWTCEEVRND